MTSPYDDPLTSAIAKFKQKGQGMPANQMQAWAMAGQAGDLTADEANAFINAAGNPQMQAAWNQPSLDDPNNIPINSPTEVGMNQGLGAQATAGPMGTGFSPNPNPRTMVPGVDYPDSSNQTYTINGDPNQDPSLPQNVPAALASSSGQANVGIAQDAIKNLLAKLMGGGQ